MRWFVFIALMAAAIVLLSCTSRDPWRDYTIATEEILR